MSDTQDLDELWRSTVSEEETRSPEDEPAPGFLGFLKENWLWIVVPALAVIVLLVALAVWIGMTTGDESDATPFTYTAY